MYSLERKMKMQYREFVNVAKKFILSCDYLKDKAPYAHFEYCLGGITAVVCAFACQDMLKEEAKERNMGDIYRMVTIDTLEEIMAAK